MQQHNHSKHLTWISPLKRSLKGKTLQNRQLVKYAVVKSWKGITNKETRNLVVYVGCKYYFLSILKVFLTLI